MTRKRKKRRKKKRERPEDLVHPMVVRVAVEALVHVVEHADHVVGRTLAGDGREGHNVTEQHRHTLELLCTVPSQCGSTFIVSADPSLRYTSMLLGR